MILVYIQEYSTGQEFCQALFKNNSHFIFDASGRPVGARHALPAEFYTQKPARQKPSPGGRWHAKGVTDEGR